MCQHTSWSSRLLLASFCPSIDVDSASYLSFARASESRPFSSCVRRLCVRSKFAYWPILHRKRLPLAPEWLHFWPLIDCCSRPLPPTSLDHSGLTSPFPGLDVVRGTTTYSTSCDGWGEAAFVHSVGTLQGVFHQGAHQSLPASALACCWQSFDWQPLRASPSLT